MHWFRTGVAVLVIAVLLVATGYAAPAAAQQAEGIAFTCGNGLRFSNAVQIVGNFRPGQYRAYAVGIDGFDPMLAVEDSAGNLICVDDSPEAANFEIGVPTAVSQGSARSSYILFANDTNDFENISIYVAGYQGANGQVVLVVDGMQVTSDDGTGVGAGDPFLINPTPNLLAANQPVVVYGYATEAGLDPMLVLAQPSGNTFDPIVLDDDTVVYCDDAGNPDLCFGETQSLTGYGGQQTDAMLVLPVDLLAQIESPVVLATSYNQQSFGSYLLGFDMVISDTFLADATQGGTTQGSDDIELTGELAYGDQITTTLSAQVIDVYAFEGRAGDEVIIVMTSDDLDPVLELYDGDGALIGQNDNWEPGGTLDALIGPIELPSTGTYLIAAFSNGGEADVGASYVIGISTRDTVPTPSGGGGTVQLPTSPPDPFGNTTQSGGGSSAGTTGNTVNANSGEIAVGDVVTGTLEAGAINRYALPLEGGEILTIDLESANFDTYLGLESETGTTLIVDDDGGDVGLNSRITNFQITRAGTYVVTVQSFDGRGGPYTLTVRDAAAGSSAGTIGGSNTTGGTTSSGSGMTSTSNVTSDLPAGSFSIVYGETIEVEVTDNIAIIAFAASDDDVVTVTAQSDDFVPVLAIFSLDAEEVAQVTGRGDTAVLTNVPITDGGVYAILVGGLDETDVGSVTVTLELSG